MSGHVLEQSFEYFFVVHLTHWQRELNVSQFCLVILAMTTFPQSPDDSVAHVLEDLVQKNPELEEHLVDPH